MTLTLSFFNFICLKLSEVPGPEKLKGIFRTANLSHLTPYSFPHPSFPSHFLLLAFSSLPFLSAIFLSSTLLLNPSFSFFHPPRPHSSPTIFARVRIDPWTLGGSTPMERLLHFTDIRRRPIEAGHDRSEGGVRQDYR